MARQQRYMWRWQNQNIPKVTFWRTLQNHWKYESKPSATQGEDYIKGGIKKKILFWATQKGGGEGGGLAQSEIYLSERKKKRRIIAGCREAKRKFLFGTEMGEEESERWVRRGIKKLFFFSSEKLWNSETPPPSSNLEGVTLPLIWIWDPLCQTEGASVV